MTTELAARNRRVLAERCHWPAGALDACERLEAKHPDWWVAWLPKNATPGFERPAGFWATRGGYHAVDILGADPDAVGAAMEEAPPVHTWDREPGCWCRGKDVPQVIRVRLDA